MAVTHPISFRRIFHLLAIALFCAFCLSVTFGLLEAYLRSFIVRPLAEFTRIPAESLLFFSFYLFIVCSTVLLLLLYWIFSDDKRLRSAPLQYVSRLMARDYYQELRRLNLDPLLGTIAERAGDKDSEVPDDQVGLDKLGAGTTTSYSQILRADLKSPETHYTGIQKSFYPEGRVAKEVPFTDGLVDGIVRTYYEDGQVHQERSYRQGKLNGIFRAFDEKGVLYFEIEYKNGIQDGMENSYNRYGVLQYKDTYRNGKRTNRKTYDEQGKVKFDQALKE